VSVILILPVAEEFAASKWGFALPKISQKAGQSQFWGWCDSFAKADSLRLISLAQLRT
jgi:hypothetical protein